MRIIQPGLHRILDFATVITFAVAPMLFGFAGAPATLSYVLAAVHLLLTLLTRYPVAPSPLTARGLVPFPIHGGIELVVGVALLLLPYILGWTGSARNFYVASAIVFVIVFFLTDYRASNSRTFEFKS